MSAKAALRELVDALDEREAEDALACVRAVIDYGGKGDGWSRTEENVDPKRRSVPSLIPGRDFLNQPPRTWEEMAAEQGV
jgi:hypothetical protein